MNGSKVGVPVRTSVSYLIWHGLHRKLSTLRRRRPAEIKLIDFHFADRKLNPLRVVPDNGFQLSTTRVRLFERITVSFLILTPSERLHYSRYEFKLPVELDFINYFVNSDGNDCGELHFTFYNAILFLINIYFANVNSFEFFMYYLL